jgi:putative membrane protein
MNETESVIFGLERPHPDLLKTYFVQSLLTGPVFLVLFPVLFCRYHTLRYRFDAEGVSMRWGILFRHQVNLTYSRIQDIHLHAGLIQRWFGLAELKIQTASGNAAAEMSIEGFHEFARIRDFLYARMRGLKDERASSVPVGPSSDADPEIRKILSEIVEEVRASRTIIESIREETRTGEQEGNV